MGAVTVRAKDVFGPAARVITFLYAAGNINASAQRAVPTGPNYTAGELQKKESTVRMGEIVQIWQSETSEWSVILDAAASLCDGVAKRDTGTFLFAMTLLNEFLGAASWVAYRFVDAFRLGSHPLDSSMTDSWSSFESSANQVIEEFSRIVEEANGAFKVELKANPVKIRPLT